MKITWEEHIKVWRPISVMSNGVYITKTGLVIVLLNDKYFKQQDGKVVTGNCKDIENCEVQPYNHEVVLRFRN